MWLVYSLFLTHFSFASHISGGEIYYTYLGKSTVDPNKLSYKITLLLYKDTTVTGANVANLRSSYNISIYRGDNNALVNNYVVNEIKYEYMKLSTYSPCLSNKPRVEFAVATYETTVDLSPLPEGYFVSHSQCCRVATIVNMNSNLVGVSYWVKIPGVNENPFAPDNSSAYFLKKDTILVCKSSPLKLDFSAQDPDPGDSLVYSLVPGYKGAGPPPNQLPVQSDLPPYTLVSYQPGYSYLEPFGNNATVINPTSGMVTGVAPAVTGIYLIAVMAEEYRNGKKVGEHRKEFQLKVEDCSLTAASLKPSYISCDSFNISFQNESSNSSIVSYLWDFGEKNVPNPTSTSPMPTYTYKDTGTYQLKLTVGSLGGCQDSTSATVKIYPGFKANFTIKGNCFLNAYQFLDASTVKYGVVNSWHWNFGDTTTFADTATSKDSAWKYPAPMNAKITLVVSSSKGCLDSTTQVLKVADKPTVNLPFRDTLICSIDTLALKVNTSNSATVNWVPNNVANQSRILMANTANPLVFPKDTTSYIVTINDNGCINSDSVKVNVLNYITVQLGPDTTICATDSITLRPVSYALSYRWSPAYALNNATVKYPLAAPLVNTTYQVLANLGKCQANAQILVKVAPYPVISVFSRDTAICYGNSVPLHASSNASIFSWSPAGSMILANTLNPVAGPVRTTHYVLTVRDTTAGGCPKPVNDTVVVTVIPPVTVNAGSDTSILANQPLQLNATGQGTLFSWFPTTWLDNPYIASPIATIPASVDSIRYKVRVTDSIGCYGEDVMTVRIYKTGPEIFVPSAFSPNGDGRNDILKPIIVGIRQLLFFRIYNRWGQLLFSTSETGKGWDGTFSGVKQASGTYVYETQGVDYTGKTVLRKGTVVLIR